MFVRPQILLVLRYLPSSKGGGAEQRALTSLMALAKIGDVHIFLYDFDRSPAEKVELEPPFRPLVKTLGRAADLAGVGTEDWSNITEPSWTDKLFGSAWVTSGRMFNAKSGQTRELIKILQRQAGVTQFDVVFTYQAHCAMLVSDGLPTLVAPRGVSILDWDAAESKAMQTLTKHAMSRFDVTSTISGIWNSIKLQPFEKKLIKAWNIILCASHLDVDYFKTKIGRTSQKVFCVPNAVIVRDVSSYEFDRILPSRKVIFVGSLSYWPNNEGALHFLKDIWPEVRQAIPNVELKFVGRGPSAALMAYHGKNGVSVVGEVAEVDPYYLEADVAIAPMIFSVGSAIKILEALTFRKALVGYEISTSRHGLIDGIHVSVAKTCPEFRSKLIALLQDKEMSERLATSGFQYVSDNFSRPKIVEELSNHVLVELGKVSS